MTMAMMLMLLLSTILVIEDPIVSFWKDGDSEMHNDNAVFNLAPEEALILANLMI
jgi:hypothetical protein